MAAARHAPQPARTNSSPERCASSRRAWTTWPPRRARRRRSARRSASAATSRAMRSGATITRCCARGSQQLADDIRARDRPVRLPRVRGLGAGAGKGARAQRRSRLDRQAHEPHRRATPAHGSSSANSSPTCRCRWTRRRATTAARCTRLHRRLPDRRDHRALPARRAPLHLLPHHRARTARFPRSSAPRSATAIYGCDDCQLVCPWNKFARVAAEPDFRVAPRRSMRATWSSCSPGARHEFLRAHRRQRDPPHRLTSAGCAISRSRWAMRRTTAEVVRRWQRGGIIVGAGARARGAGRWTSTGRSRAKASDSLAHCR